MEMFHKNRWLFWVLIFLVVVNLAAVGTYFFYPRKQAVITCKEGDLTPGCAYRNKLDLTDEQSRQVDLVSEEYLAISGPLAELIRGVRSDILDGLSASEPDTVHLNELASELSKLQAALHRENIKHYLALKEVCTPEQALRLSNLYRELYGCPMQGQGRGIKHKFRK